jgi:hypothetical protein
VDNEPTTQNIFSNREFQYLVADYASKTQSSLLIFSAFIKLNALEWLASQIEMVPEVRIVARWRPEDLAFKASDIEAYEFCHTHGWKFGIDNSLHSKAFVFDSKTVLLGSANLTDRGLSLSRDGNLEMGTVIVPTIADLERLKSLEENVFWMNDDIFKSLAEEMKAMEITKPKTPSWSPDLIERLNPKIDFLWVSELLHSSPESFQWVNLDDEEQMHDFELLGLNMESCQDEMRIRKAFLSSRLYLWFKSELAKEMDNPYTNFGWLTEKLHNALLDKPPPKRSGIKEFVADFVLWLESYALEDIEIVQHQKTKSFQLRE